MSNRTLIEINHDYVPEVCTVEMLSRLRLYLNCADRETAEALSDATHGAVRVISRRHHADKFHIDLKTDGFPATYYGKDAR